jgi:hypothetical protein
LALAIVTVDEVGAKTKLTLDGVTVYVPLARPAKLKLPDESVTAVAVPAPVNAIVTPVPLADGATVPEIEYVVPEEEEPVKLIPVKLEVVTLTAVLIGLNV